MALLIILIMLILGVILAIYYLPHPQKPFRANKNYTFETAEELSPKELTNDLYHFSPAELSKAEIDYTLPDKYDEDQICLMVRDPEWLFAFWEISASTKDRFSSEHGSSFFDTTQVLRVYNLSESEDSNAFFDITLHDSVNRWHINFGKPNQRIYISIGRILENGLFVPILTSNSVLLPRTTISSVLDENWLPYSDVDYSLYQLGQPYSSYSLFHKERID